MTVSYQFADGYVELADWPANRFMRVENDKLVLRYKGRDFELSSIDHFGDGATFRECESAA